MFIDACLVHLSGNYDWHDRSTFFCCRLMQVPGIHTRSLAIKEKSWPITLDSAPF